MERYKFGCRKLGYSKKGLRLNRTIKNIDLLESAQENKKQQATIACVEWIEPLMFAGNWVPEMVEIAGGNDIFGSKEFTHHGTHLKIFKIRS